MHEPPTPRRTFDAFNHNAVSQCSMFPGREIRRRSGLDKAHGGRAGGRRRWSPGTIECFSAAVTQFAGGAARARCTCMSRERTAARSDQMMDRRYKVDESTVDNDDDESERGAAMPSNERLWMYDGHARCPLAFLR